MDDTAIEGYYYRSHTTAYEAQRIGLEIIRNAVGEHVLLDKDGSPMLNPVGIVDEGRISEDTAHVFSAIRRTGVGIAARYYMNRNFFVSDPDAFTVSSELVVPDQARNQSEKPLSLNEAEVSIVLAAASGGMFEIGDDLPTLASAPDRLAMVENQDLIHMAQLGRASIPLDLMTYRREDEQPSVFLLHEDRRQTMLASSFDIRLGWHIVTPDEIDSRVHKNELPDRSLRRRRVGSVSATEPTRAPTESDPKSPCPLDV